jgi:hypothetical protein
MITVDDMIVRNKMMYLVSGETGPVPEDLIQWHVGVFDNREAAEKLVRKLQKYVSETYPNWCPTVRNNVGSMKLHVPDDTQAVMMDNSGVNYSVVEVPHLEDFVG